MPVPNTDFTRLRGALDRQEAGRAIHALIRDLYPICRSITGDGMRADAGTAARRNSASRCSEVPSGTQVFDWTVPREWNIRDAYVKNSNGERVIDFRRHNLHVVNYSVPVRGRMSLAELRPHLHTLPDQPDWIPYRTSYYKETWGFCLPHRQLEQMPEGEYEVCIDSTLQDGPPELWRMPAEGKLGAGSACLLPRLPSVAVQRQPVGHRRGRLAAPASGPAAAALLLPLPVHPGHHRLDHLAQPE